MKKFTVDARAVLTLGRDSIKDHTTAVIELVKNSYDADARAVLVAIISRAPQNGLIKIKDIGAGMSEEEVENNWLRIGFSAKRTEKITAKHFRRKTGEKGIGRLSADRLGKKLELRTKAEGSKAIGILVDWSQFESNSKEVGDIRIPILKKPKIKPINQFSRKTPQSGTELRITDLRQKWNLNDIKKLHSELSLLLPSHQEINSNFEIFFYNDIDYDLNGRVESSVENKGEIEFVGNLTNEGDVNFNIDYRDRKTNKRKVVPGTISKNLFFPSIKNDSAEQKITTGPLTIRLSFFLRDASILEKSGLNLSSLRKFLDKNSGIRIYRDFIRVKPYGDPDSTEEDWVGLNSRKLSNPAGAGRQSFKVSSSQIVGSVFVSMDSNPKIVDSSSREGLIENDEFRQLRRIILMCITQIESFHHKLHLDEQDDPSTTAAKAKIAVNNLLSELTNLKSELVDFRSQAKEKGSPQTTTPLEQIEVVLQRIKIAEREIEEIASQNTVYRGLATVGIASAVFGHETEASTDQAQGRIKIAALKLQKASPDIAGALKNILEAESHIQQIASWGKFALLRVKKDKRQKIKISINQIINNALSELRRPLKESDIAVHTNLDEVTAKTFPMDIEAVLINFVTNAYYAVKKTTHNRIINVKLARIEKNNRPGYEISVSDSGHGIESGHKHMVWKPLFSTKIDEKGKPTGTGLGLTIVKSAVEELGGEVSVIGNSTLGGAEFKAWFPES